LVVILSLTMIAPTQASSSLLQATGEPPPRDTPTPGPTWTASPTPTPTPTATSTPLPAATLVLQPTQGVATQATKVLATGEWWTPGTVVTLYWDDTDRELENTTVSGNGTISVEWKTPTGTRATVGVHTIIAIATGGKRAEALFTLTAPPPSNTPTASLTPTPSATLHPITPMVSITPIPPTKQPTQAATRTPAPTSLPGTATVTRTPTKTYTPSPTPGPGTPSSTPVALLLPTATPTPVEEIAQTGSGWGTLLLWGFVLAGLLIAFRVLRVRGLGSQG
jgi:hypothetical protein